MGIGVSGVRSLVGCHRRIDKITSAWRFGHLHTEVKGLSARADLNAGNEGWGKRLQRRMYCCDRWIFLIRRPDRRGRISFCRKTGHQVTDIMPALVPLELKNLRKELPGVVASECDFWRYMMEKVV